MVVDALLVNDDDVVTADAVFEEESDVSRLSTFDDVDDTVVAAVVSVVSFIARESEVDDFCQLIVVPPTLKLLFLDVPI